MYICLMLSDVEEEDNQDTSSSLPPFERLVLWREADSDYEAAMAEVPEEQRRPQHKIEVNHSNSIYFIFCYFFRIII
jgi:hypothetical protein